MTTRRRIAVELLPGRFDGVTLRDSIGWLDVVPILDHMGRRKAYNFVRLLYAQ
mgnify:CR=1 FL=1